MCIDVLLAVMLIGGARVRPASNTPQASLAATLQVFLTFADTDFLKVFVTFDDTHFVTSVGQDPTPAGG